MEKGKRRGLSTTAKRCTRVPRTMAPSPEDTFWGGERPRLMSKGCVNLAKGMIWGKEKSNGGERCAKGLALKREGISSKGSSVGDMIETRNVRKRKKITSCKRKKKAGQRRKQYSTTKKLINNKGATSPRRVGHSGFLDLRKRKS